MLSIFLMPILTLSQGRVFFRFIDAPFQQDWFIDEHNVVHSEWGRIREHIGAKIQITAQVTSYEMYRDIIFGNNRKHEMIPYRKFAIVESAKSPYDTERLFEFQIGC